MKSEIDLFAVVDEDHDWTSDWSPLTFLDAGYMSARFGDVPVLVTTELGEHIRAVKAGA